MGQTFAVQIDPACRKRRYKVTSVYLTMLGKARYENTTETTLMLSWLPSSKHERVFQVEIEDFTQTNKKGLNSWAEQMNALKTKFLFKADGPGQLQQVLNRYEVGARWSTLKQRIRQQVHPAKKAEAMIEGIGRVLREDERLERTLRDTPIYSLLMPGIYGAGYELNREMEDKKHLTDFLAGEAAAMRTQTRLTEFDPATKQAEVRRQGTLIEDTLNKDAIQKTVKEMTDRVDFSIQPYGGCQESYALDEHHWTTNAGQIINYGIKKAYLNRTISNLEMIE